MKMLALYCHELIGKTEDQEQKKTLGGWWLYAR